MPTRKKSKALSPLTLHPTEIVLARDSTGNKGAFTIRNNLPTPLAFKIKSTSPDAFKLKPLHGVLPAKGYMDIHVTLLPGTKCDSHEKFLVLTAMTEQGHLTSEEIHELFKDTTNTISHYLPCSILCEENDGGKLGSKRSTAERLDRMEQRIKTSMRMQVIILVLVCFLLFLFSENTKRDRNSLCNLWS